MKTGTSERPDLPLAVVVGAGGMGVSAARRLGNHYRILLTDINGDRAEERAAAMRDDGYDAVSCRSDITDLNSVARLAEAVAAQAPLRALVNVAAISPSMGAWRDIINLNLIGAAMSQRRSWPSFAFTRSAAICDQPPGAAPRSTMRPPGFRR